MSKYGVVTWGFLLLSEEHVPPTRHRPTLFVSDPNRMADEDGSGVITKDELLKLLRASGMNPIEQVRGRSTAFTSA